MATDETIDGRWFLLIRDHDSGHTQVDDFLDPDTAVAAYDDAEDRLRHLTGGVAPKFEVVLLLADSEDDLRAGYPHYFVAAPRDELRESLREKFYEESLQRMTRRWIFPDAKQASSA